MIGKEISGQYRIEERIGVGGFGKVFRGVDLRDNQIVAIKQLNQNLADDEHIERFKREGEALRELNHPNIVKMLDAVQDGDDHFLIMEYVSGGDLDDLLKQGTIPLEQTLTYAIDLADALTRAHKLNIIHRDLKPANVLIGKDSVLRLTDFGVSRIGGKDKITATGAPIGTFAYMAPEIFSSDWIDPRADIWAFGVMLFEMLTGELPFQGHSITQLIMSITANDPPDIAMLAPDVPPSLVRLIERMLEKDRSERIASVRYVGAHLEDILQGRDTPIVESISIEQVLKLPIRPEHNLPSDLTPFVGREVEIAEITHLIDAPEHRLITILASGGMGKTRIAVEVARQYIGQFRDGVFLVSLQALSNPENIVSEIASSTNFPLQSGDAKQQVLQFLANKHMLLVFDNFEHLLDGASIIADIMSHAPDVTMLVTSRERLHLTAETIYSLPEMACPMDILQDMLNFDAVRFLIQSAQHVKSDWQLTEENLNDVFRITQLTQGMPLGILLAMSWLDMMPIAKIADEIQRDIDFLSADLRDLPDRHQSVRAIFNGTWQRLNDSEQSALAKISVFRGGFTREAAQEVTGANLRVLHALTNKSLIRVDETGRYSIHELLRQFAEEHFNQRDDVDDIHDAYLKYYAEVLSREAPRLEGTERLDALMNVTRDWENIRVVWNQAHRQGQWHLLLMMIRPFRSLGKAAEFATPTYELVKMTLEHLQSQPSMEEAQERLFVNLFTIINKALIADEKHLHSALEVAKKHGETYAWVHLQRSLANKRINQQQAEEGKQHLEDAIEVATRSNDPNLLAEAMVARGYYALIVEGNYEQLRENRLQVLEIAKENDNQYLVTQMATDIANIYLNQGEWERARKQYEEILPICQKMKFLWSYIKCLDSLSKIHNCFMRLEQAKSYLNRMKSIADTYNTDQFKSRVGLYTAMLNFAKGNISSALENIMYEYLGTKRHKKADYFAWVARWHMLCQSLLGNFSTCLEDTPYVIPFDLKISWNSMLILDCMIFLPMLQDQGDDIRSVELIAMMNEHPKALPISNQHPYVLELEAQLQDCLDEDTYQQAWGRGAQLDPIEVAPALMEEFTAIYG